MANKNLTTRNSESSPVGKAIQDLLEQYKLTRKYQETQVVQAWSKIMGDPISKRTYKIFVKDRVLYVYLNSGPLRNELSYSRSRILGLYYQEFGQQVIDDVKIM